MRIGIVAFTKFGKRLLENVSDHNSLADVQIPKWVEMDASGFAQILVPTLREVIPWILFRTRSELGRRARPRNMTAS